MSEPIKPLDLTFHIGIVPDTETIAFQDALDDYAGKVRIKYLDTKEKAFRETLIKLGWTPPGELADRYTELLAIGDQLYSHLKDRVKHEQWEKEALQALDDFQAFKNKNL